MCVFICFALDSEIKIIFVGQNFQNSVRVAYFQRVYYSQQHINSRSRHTLCQQEVPCKNLPQRLLLFVFVSKVSPSAFQSIISRSKVSIKSVPSHATTKSHGTPFYVKDGRSGRFLFREQNGR